MGGKKRKKKRKCQNVCGCGNGWAVSKNFTTLKNTNTYQTHVLHYEYYKHMFSQHFLNMPMESRNILSFCLFSSFE